ncbi:ras guanine nucleotide exchange factor domain-containing protein [Geopyxis carbonaria]|nr:ras guanine nucleotide exchange factor domain-containing protein [Geopyxis carbonaria]
MYVRALYNYATEDQTSLSFQQGDVIQVLKQLESGWWDGIVNNQRGWFPSNYCQFIPEGELVEGQTGNSPLDDSDDLDEDDSYDEYEENDDESDRDGQGSPGLPLEGTDSRENDEAAFWIPQATPDGRLYYFNTITGDSRAELPLETPTSTTEMGPRDRTHISVPDQTRPPPELMARGYEREEPSFNYVPDEDSLSDREPESTVMNNGTRTPERQFTERISGTTLADSAATSMDSRTTRPKHSPSFSQPFAQPAAAATALTVYTKTDSSTSYYPDSTPIPQSWEELLEKTGYAVERYRNVVHTYTRAEYVRRAEHISDLLRLLITAGSATTDNHSGQPSIISTNKTLNPHFRHFMAAFSKLVLSSHVACVDFRPTDAETKCLAEADEVMVGVFGFAETAKGQRGEILPRLTPGFIQGSHAGGGWKGVMAPVGSPKSPKTGATNGHSQLENMAIPLDSVLVENMEELNTVVKKAMAQLSSTLSLTETLITRRLHFLTGANIISTSQTAFDALKRYFNLIENINMLPLTQASQSPTLIDFVTQKQRLHDSFAELFMAVQTVTAPLADEWTKSKGEYFEERLGAVRTYIREVESGIRSLNFSTQLLVGEREKESQETEDNAIRTDDWRPGTNTAESIPSQMDNRRHARNRSQQVSQGSILDRTPQGPSSKARKILGENPTTQEIPKYLACDHDNEIVYGTKGGTVKGGTLVALVERLTRHDTLDSGFNTTFLLTYPSFTTASEFFTHLVRRFTIQPPPGMSTADYNDWVEKKQKLIRMRVLSILKIWLESNWMESVDDKSKDLLRKMYTFAKEVMLPQLVGTNQVLSLIETRLRGLEPENKRLVLTMSSQPPPPILPRSMKKMKFLDIEALEFARQLTILESKSYAKLRAAECLSKGWSKQPNGGVDPAENIRAIIMQSNQLTNWVAEMILSQTEPRKRVMVIKHFVTVAEKCRQLNNFSTLTSILAALQTSAIHRLRRTWEHVPQRTQTVLEGMNTLMGASMNFAEYREMLHIVNPPCVPFLGVYLKDLTFVADGNDDFIKGTELINYGKRSKTSSIIQDIQQYQAVPYVLQAVPELQDYIINSMQSARDVNEMYAVSLTLEPREREDEKIARLVASMINSAPLPSPQ